MTDPLENRASEDDRTLAQRLVREREADGARRIALLALVASAASLPFVAGVGIAISAELARRLLALMAGFAVVEGAMLLLVRTGRYRRRHGTGAVVFESSLPAMVELLDAAHGGAVYALTSAPFVLYGPIIMLTALRLRPRLVLGCGVLCATWRLLAYLLLRPALDAATIESLPSLSLANEVQRCTYLVLTGVAGWGVCRSLLGLVGDLVASVRGELRVRSLLGRHMTRQVADLLLAGGPGTAGRQMGITVLFLDIRSFTSFAERTEPGRVLALLNDFYAVMAAAVEANEGIVNKFLGDGLMAIFGAPMECADHARRAARAALQMSAEVQPLRERWGVPALEIGIGLHSGDAVVGVVGDETRGEYTAIGDTVNLAARIEALNKEYGTRILASGETLALLGEVDARVVGQTAVRGRDRPVTVAEIRGARPLAA